MNNTVSAKCFSQHFERFRADLAQNEAPEKVKLEKRGVDCEVSRRERDFRTNHQSSSVLTSSLLFRKARLNIQSNGKEKNSQEKSFTSIFQKCLRILFGPRPPTLFFYSHTTHEYFHTQPHTHHPSTMNRAIETYAKISILIARSPQAKNSRR